jgi:3-oxoacyl-[acyl-carrier-protein] synthase III
MGISIVGAAVNLPPPRKPEGVPDGAVFSCPRPFQADYKMSLEVAVPTVLRALEVARTATNQVDLLVTKGVSPSHIADVPDVMGPRVGHPIQREIGLPNAFVFDIMDGDFSLAFDIVESFFNLYPFQRAVLVHTECSAPGVKPDPETGFTLHDGASVLVVAPDPKRHRLGSTFADVDHAAPKLVPLPPDEISQGTHRMRARWSPSQGFFQALTKGASDVVARELEGEGGDPSRFLLAYEDWFPGYEVANAAISRDRVLMPSEALGRLGPHTLPAALADLYARPARSEEDEHLLAVTFNPFKMRFGARSVRVRRMS